MNRQEELEMKLKELQAKLEETRIISEQMEIILFSHNLENQLTYLD